MLHCCLRVFIKLDIEMIIIAGNEIYKYVKRNIDICFTYVL